MTDQLTAAALAILAFFLSGCPSKHLKAPLYESNSGLSILYESPEDKEDYLAEETLLLEERKKSLDKKEREFKTLVMECFSPEDRSWKDPPSLKMLQRYNSMRAHKLELHGKLMEELELLLNKEDHGHATHDKFFLTDLKLLRFKYLQRQQEALSRVYNKREKYKEKYGEDSLKDYDSNQKLEELWRRHMESRPERFTDYPSGNPILDVNEKAPPNPPSPTEI